MSIEIAKYSGFCYGVKRAVKIALNTSKKCKSVFTVGPIIHNPQMVEMLQDKGIFVKNNLKDIEKGDSVILRSHGVTKQDLELLKNSDVNIIDATCPNVAKIHSIVKEYAQNGYKILIFGDKNHSEVKAIKSYGNQDTKVILQKEDLESNLATFPKLVIVSQTTQNRQKFKRIIELIKKVNENVIVLNTICSATQVRQKATQELAKKSDIVIVVGGTNSANTKMLVKIANKFSKTFHIETSEQLEMEKIKKNMKIGLTAGASTPDWLIENVSNKLKEFLSLG